MTAEMEELAVGEAVRRVVQDSVLNQTYRARRTDRVAALRVGRSLEVGAEGETVLAEAGAEGDVDLSTEMGYLSSVNYWAEAVET